jgi:hypothetical protein
MKAIERRLSEAWGAANHKLAIEPEVFWRRGGPPKRLDARAPQNK